MICLVIGIWLLEFVSVPAHAETFPAFGPFNHRIQNPLYWQLVAMVPEKAVVLPPKTVALELTTAYSNIFERAITTTNVIIDMEVLRVGTWVRYGIAPRFEVGMEIPWFYTDTGFLDSFVQGFHNTFGLANGGRNTVQNDSFAFRIARNGTVLYDVGPETWNIGDVSLFGKVQLREEEPYWPAMTGRFVLKTPTGNRGKGLGGGNPGFAFGLDAQKSYRRFHTYLNTSYAVDVGNDRLDSINTTESFDWSFAGEFSIIKQLAMIAQLVGGTPKYHHTGSHVLDDIPLDLIIGFRGVWDRWSLQVAFSEDVTSYGPSIDFTAWTSVGYHWQIRNPKHETRNKSE